MQRAGLLKEDITFEEEEKEVGKFIPNGLSTEGHRIVHIINGNDAVGTIWYEIRGKGQSHEGGIPLGHTHQRESTGQGLRKRSYEGARENRQEGRRREDPAKHLRIQFHSEKYVPEDRASGRRDHHDETSLRHRH